MNEKTRVFIEKATKIHGLKYNYENVCYVNCNTKVQVMCNIHGIFNVTPNNHLSKKSGCPKCAKQRYGASKKQQAQTTFVEDSNKIHDNKYDYSKVVYELSHKKVIIICPTHGEFLMMPYLHRQGQGCPKCGIISRKNKRLKTTDQFIDEATKIHKDKYCYDYVNYIGNTCKVQIICTDHGPFFQRPHQHLRGEGCPECGKYNWFAEQGGYTERLFEQHPELKTNKGIIYFVEFSSNTEKFYKVGITKHTLEKRFHWGYSDYNMKIIIEHQTTLYDAWKREQHLLQHLKSHQYIPTIKIGGWTECLTQEVDNELICSIIQGNIE